MKIGFGCLRQILSIVGCIQESNVKYISLSCKLNISFKKLLVEKNYTTNSCNDSPMNSHWFEIYCQYWHLTGCFHNTDISLGVFTIPAFYWVFSQYPHLTGCFHNTDIWLGVSGLVSPRPSILSTLIASVKPLGG